MFIIVNKLIKIDKIAQYIRISIKSLPKNYNNLRVRKKRNAKRRKKLKRRIYFCTIVDEPRASRKPDEDMEMETF